MKAVAKAIGHDITSALRHPRTQKAISDLTMITLGLLALVSILLLGSLLDRAVVKEIWTGSLLVWKVVSTVAALFFAGKVVRALVRRYSGLTAERPVEDVAAVKALAGIPTPHMLTMGEASSNGVLVEAG